MKKRIWALIGIIFAVFLLCTCWPRTLDSYLPETHPDSIYIAYGPGVTITEAEDIDELYDLLGRYKTSGVAIRSYFKNFNKVGILHNDIYVNEKMCLTVAYNFVSSKGPSLKVKQQKVFYEEFLDYATKMRDKYN